MVCMLRSGYGRVPVTETYVKLLGSIVKVSGMDFSVRYLNKNRKDYVVQRPENVDLRIVYRDCSGEACVSSQNRTGLFFEESELRFLTDGVVVYVIRRVGVAQYEVRVYAELEKYALFPILICLLLENVKKGFVGMHAATLKYRDRVILFSAPSGTGKSTMCFFWKLLHGGETINGDYALLKREGKDVFMWGTPFCGGSRICKNTVERVTDIVFLSQSDTDYGYRVSGGQAAISFAKNCFIPQWDPDLASIVLERIMEMQECVTTWHMRCTKSPNGARTLQKLLFDGVK